VATAVGGIPEVVVDRETGLLVPVEFRSDDAMTPADPERLAGELAAAINLLMADPQRRTAMGTAGRTRAVERFSWSSIAQQTVALYQGLLG
jgi:alpha-maltose-1-phosphate synthase